MGHSRLAWACSAFAPWAVGLVVLVSITAQAGEELGDGGRIGAISRGAVVEAVRFSTVFQSFNLGASAFGGSPTLASLYIGDSGDWREIADEIEPNPAMKAHSSSLPSIDRSAKGDPFFVLRPGFDARIGPRNSEKTRSALDRGDDSSRSDDGQTPSAADGFAPVANSAGTIIAGEPRSFDDGATPEAPLDVELSSATPTSADSRLLVLSTAATPQTTIAAQSDSSPRPDYSTLIPADDAQRQMQCLAEAVYFESRSEPLEGQAAVAQIVLNRVRSGLYPSTVCGVVYQDRERPFACQFSFACEGKALRIDEPGPWAVAMRISREVVDGERYDPLLSEALNYHASYVFPFWAPQLRRVERIGAHIFYAMRPGVIWAPGANVARIDAAPAAK